MYQIEMQEYREGLDVTAISVAQMREADRRTIDGGVPSKELMRRAAQGVFEAAGSVWENKRTLVICGSGNNGGDGYALAEIMDSHGLDVTLLMVTDKFSEDGGYYYARCQERAVPSYSLAEWLQDAEDPMHREEILSTRFAAYDVFVDCIFGTGFSGEPRGVSAEVIRAVNDRHAQGAYTIAVDINSGMNGDTGEAVLAVASDLTVSIGYFKQGFFSKQAGALIGRLVNVDIGIRL